MDDARPGENLIERSWVHSREEDDGGSIVYRPSGYAFPPARGRDSFTLGAGGAAVFGSPGPDDRTVGTAGSWSADADRLTLQPDGSAATRYRIARLEQDRLVLSAEPAEAVEGNSDGTS